MNQQKQINLDKIIDSSYDDYNKGAFSSVNVHAEISTKNNSQLDIDQLCKSYLDNNLTNEDIKKESKYEGETKIQLKSKSS